MINRYANAGTFVITALLKAEQMLRAKNDLRRIVMLYEHAWSQIRSPGEMAPEFARQSNYFRVGQMYAQRLEEAGLRSEASRVRTAIGEAKSGR